MAFVRTLTHLFIGTGRRSAILHRTKLQCGGRGMHIQASVPGEKISPPLGAGTLLEWKWGIDGAEGLRRSVIPSPTLLPAQRLVPAEHGRRQGKGWSAAEGWKARKAIKACEMEMVKSRLREITKGTVVYSEFLRMCCESSCADQGPLIARYLDESGAVMVLGNVVFLRPKQLAKAIEGVIPLSLSPRDDPRREELRKLEEQKALIDKKAEARVRREMWSGLAFLSLQTACFMRLTFWELSWDVMEPICFYVTSLYCMAGYVFFMRTSTDPSFEGFFRSRFAVKQRQLMEAHRFDARRLNELRGLSSPASLLCL